MMSKWPRMRLTKYVDDLTLRYKGAHRFVASVITEAVSSMMGWLEIEFDFRVSKDEEETEGKSVVPSRRQGQVQQQIRAR